MRVYQILTKLIGQNENCWQNEGELAQGVDFPDLTTCIRHHIMSGVIFTHTTRKPTRHHFVSGSREVVAIFRRNIPRKYRNGDSRERET